MAEDLLLKAGLLDRVKASLAAEIFYSPNWGVLCQTHESGLVYKGIEFAKKKKLILFWCRGGSTIDSSKAIALGSLYDGGFLGFLRRQIDLKALPVATILTFCCRK